MGTFMSTSKRLVVRNSTSELILALNTATTVALHIYERNQNTIISEVHYQVEKIAGRDSTVAIAWTDISTAGSLSDLYSFDITLTGILKTDKLQLSIKVVDIDGIEFFVTYNDIKLVV